MTAWLAGKFAQITNNQTKNDIVRRTARLLADAVYHYTQTEAGRDQRQQLGARRCVIAETQLKAMTKGPGGQAQPDVTTAMTDGGTDRNTKMEKEIGAWIGTAQTAGVLNGAPFNFERGLAIKRPAARQRPRPPPLRPADGRPAGVPVIGSLCLTRSDSWRPPAYAIADGCHCRTPERGQEFPAQHAGRQADQHRRPDGRRDPRPRPGAL